MSTLPTLPLWLLCDCKKSTLLHSIVSSVEERTAHCVMYISDMSRVISHVRLTIHTCKGSHYIFPLSRGWYSTHYLQRCWRCAYPVLEEMNILCLCSPIVKLIFVPHSSPLPPRWADRVSHHVGSSTQNSSQDVFLPAKWKSFTGLFLHICTYIRMYVHTYAYALIYIQQITHG